MNNSNICSKNVRQEIFESLLNEPRFASIVNTVVDGFRHGQNPVIIESWNAFWQRHPFTDDLWKRVIPEREMKNFMYAIGCKHANICVKSSLNVMLPKPYSDGRIYINVVEGVKPLYKRYVTIPTELLTELIYFGHVDKNYFTLLFTSLGYKVTEGNVGGRYGLLITFGE